MRELNRRYRRKDRTTDVLSFGQSLRRGAKGEIAASALKPVQLSNVPAPDPRVTRSVR